MFMRSSVLIIRGSRASLRTDEGFYMEIVSFYPYSTDPHIMVQIRVSRQGCLKARFLSILHVLSRRPYTQPWTIRLFP